MTDEVAGFAIAGRRIGRAEPPYVIAEVSANHSGSLERALRIIDAAADAGADAVKLQTYTAEGITLDSERADFRIEGGLWGGRTLFDLYTEASTPWAWHADLFAHARARGLAAFSSPFDRAAVDFLTEIGVPAFKVASFELVDLPLIEYIAAAGRPMIMSTGMASPTEVDEALAAARRGGCSEVALLSCVSGYPTPVEEANLATIPDMRARWGVEIGLSDHTLGIGVATAAVTLGASIVEKHLTLDRADGGPDAAFSMHPDEFAGLVAAARQAHAAVGEVRYGCKPSEAGNRRFRRSLYAVADIAAGDALDDGNVRSIRPAHGLAPKHLGAVLGRRAARDIARGEALAWDMLDGGRNGA